MALVEVRGVTKEYRKGDQKITPLIEVDLTVEKGDFVSLMGASGSGKSTLLNLVAGIDRPNAGRIVVNGTDITRLSRTRLAHWRAAHVGYIFQMHNLIPVLTAYENVEMPLLLGPLSLTRPWSSPMSRPGVAQLGLPKILQPWPPEVATSIGHGSSSCLTAPYDRPGAAPLRSQGFRSASANISALSGHVGRTPRHR
jgi:predicted ABC-type transport system involved in lysophospholipase L1 biosynthesis ATPase subunit